MALPADVQSKFDEIDVATTALGTEVTRLRDLVHTGMTAADVATVKDKLTAVATALNGIAADPDNPVPVPPP